MPRKSCAVSSCSSSVKDGVIFHKFPNPSTCPERFRSWVTNAGIVDKDDNYIYTKRKICHLHFDKIYEYPRNKLSSLAVPTLHLTAEQSTAGQQTAAMKSAKRIGKTALQCCITGCNVRTRHHAMLHRFPNSKESPQLYKAWLRAATGGAERSASTQWADKRVCSRHFERKHFRGEVLATDAAPTLCLTEAENAAYVERRVSDELTSYLHRKTVLQGQTPVGANADEGSVQGQSDLPIRDLIIPTGPRVKKLGRHSHYGCSVKGCYATKVAGIDFFPFPDNKLRQKQWLKSIILSESRPMSELRVCTRHFAPGSFRDVNLGLLKTTAVPTLHTGQRSTPKLPPPAPESQIQQVCCTCLAIDVKMYKLNDEQRQHYAQLLDVKSGTGDVKRESESEMAATTVCYECVGALAKLSEFRERARVARSTLLRYTHSGQSIKELDRSSLGLSSPLSWCNLDGYSIEPEAAESGDAAGEPTEDPIGLDMEVEENDSYEAKNMEERCKERSRYECDVCGEKFKQRSALVRHVTAHSLDNNWGWEKHVCDMCFRSFPHSSVLLEHVSRHHTRSAFHYAEIIEQAARTRRNVFIDNRSVTKPNSRIDCNEEFSKRNTRRVVRVVPSNAKRRLLSVKLNRGRARGLVAKGERAKRRELVKEGKFERIDVMEILKDAKVKDEPLLDMEVLDENFKADV